MYARLGYTQLYPSNNIYLLGVGSLDADPGLGRPDLGAGMPLLWGDKVLPGDKVLSAGDKVLPGEACLAPLPGLRARCAGLVIMRGGDSLLPPWNTERPLLPKDLDKFGRLLRCFSANEEKSVLIFI